MKEAQSIVRLVELTKPRCQDEFFEEDIRV